MRKHFTAKSLYSASSWPKIFTIDCGISWKQSHATAAKQQAIKMCIRDREAYQSQVDISLNKTMKVLTVVTAIISPLTLIAGWYGMNLQMPEYHWSFGYPLVIGLSIAAIGLCIAYFRKHKWF